MDQLVWGIGGLIILLVAGDLMVRGAVALSLRLGIPAMIVSLTIVAFGTSAPELLVSVDAALTGSPGLALGNVIGSNIANILLVLAVPALVSGLDTSGVDSRDSYLQMLGVMILFIVLLFLGPLQVWHGLLLLSLLTVAILRAVREARRHRDAAEYDPDLPADAAYMPLWQAVAYLVVGIAGLPLGADLLVGAAREIALDIGVSEEVIGLSLVAIGTSLPELATTVMAAVRNQAEVALGNVIGSNIMNVLAIMGVTSLFGPLPVDPQLLRLDVWVMLAASVALAPFVLARRRIGPVPAAAFLGVYAAYMIALF